MNDILSQLPLINECLAYGQLGPGRPPKLRYEHLKMITDMILTLTKEMQDNEPGPPTREQMRCLVKAVNLIGKARTLRKEKNVNKEKAG